MIGDMILGSIALRRRAPVSRSGMAMYVVPLWASRVTSGQKGPHSSAQSTCNPQGEILLATYQIPQKQNPLYPIPRKGDGYFLAGLGCDTREHSGSRPGGVPHFADIGYPTHRLNALCGVRHAHGAKAPRSETTDVSDLRGHAPSLLPLLRTVRREPRDVERS